MKEIIISYILAFILTIVSSLIYTLLGFNNLSKFANNYLIYILLTYYLVTINYLYKKNKLKENRLSFKNYFPLISLGTTIAIIYNMIVFIFKPLTTPSKTPLILLILSTGIVGPIFEEILYRYIFYNRLKKKHKTPIAILINSIIFALTHMRIIKIIYAFILGSILNIIYEKFKNIKAPILVHISANIIVLFLHEYNSLVLLLSIINLIISINLIKNIKMS